MSHTVSQSEINVNLHRSLPMPSSKILWALDPFHKNSKVFKNSVALLKILSEKTRAKIEPVYVVSPAEARVALEFSVPAKKRFEVVATAAMQKILKEVRLPGLLKPKILVENHLRISASAKTMAQYAAKQKALCIVVGTQAKQGLDRLVLGSFAETLILNSSTPLLLINPHCQTPSRLDSVLFATDFSKASKRAFSKVASLASKLAAEITLFHVIPKPFRWTEEAADLLFGHGEMSTKQYFELESQARVREAEKLQKELKGLKVPITLHVEKSSESVAELTLAYAKKSKAKLIAMAAQSGMVAATVLGSATREVLRQAKVPVWVESNR